MLWTESNSVKSDTQVQQDYESARLALFLVCWMIATGTLLVWPVSQVYPMLPAGFLCETDIECEEMEEVNPALFVGEKE